MFDLGHLVTWFLIGGGIAYLLKRIIKSAIEEAKEAKIKMIIKLYRKSSKSTGSPQFKF